MPAEVDLSWPEDLEALARSWLAEMREGNPPREADFSSKVVFMSFLAPAATQWTFLCAAVAAAQTEDDLGDIAAGPFEQLLSSHSGYIEAVEARALADPAFARMTIYAWQHLMTDDVWARVQAIQETADGLD